MKSYAAISQQYHSSLKISRRTGPVESYEGKDTLNFLTKWSLFDHDDYCLAMLFTYRDFSGGVLGLAWVGDPEEGSPGGICSKRVIIESTGESFNFNTAVVSFLNYGNRVPRVASVAMVTHELGHNFGAGVGTLEFLILRSLDELHE